MCVCVCEHRKSTSLAPGTRWSLIQALCQAVKILSSILGDDQNDEETQESQQATTQRQSNVILCKFVHVKSST